MNTLLLAMIAPAVSQAADGSLPDKQPEVQPRHELWIGSLSVPGERKVPLLGKVEFRTDSHLLAVITWTDENHFRITQQTCQVKFPKSMGAQITMSDHASQRVPPASYEWSRDADKLWSAGPWPSGWDEKDHDGDAFPGITFEVAAPFCGGDLYVASSAQQTAQGRREPNGHLKATIDVHVEQTILGARGPCLNLMARDTTDWMHGHFLLHPLDADTRQQILGDAKLAPNGSTLSDLCQRVPADIWPDAWQDVQAN